MKVYIGPYTRRVNSYIHTDYMNKKYGAVDWPDDYQYTKYEHFLDKVEDGLQWFYNQTINRLFDKRESQKIKVRIDYYDIWSADHTLAHIIVPLLKMLKENKHGAPCVDDEDVPAELRSKAAPKLTKKQKENGSTDDNFFKRWDWVIDEMIWAFEQKTNEDADSVFYTPSFDKPKWEDWNARKSNGYRLFGKYYEALWD